MPSNQPDRPLFIHGAVDDYGFSPAEFRVLCAIARRGECYECVDHLAARCRIHLDTARRVLKSLVARQIVQRTWRPGRTSLLRVNPLSVWQPHGKQGCPLKSESPLGKEGGHPSEKKGEKVYPIKLLPRRKHHDYSKGF